MQPDIPPLLYAHGLRDRKVLRGVSLRVHPGQFVCLLGNRGAGKSAAMKIIAGLDSPDGGDVFLDEKKITNDWPGRRRLCYVPQKPKHFMRPSLPSADDEKLSAIGLSPSALLDEEKRTILRIVRAIGLRPRLLVIDGTADAFDDPVREKLFDAMKEAARQGTGVLYATSNTRDAMRYADYLFLLHEGLIIQSGTPTDVYEQPTSETAARLTGECLLFRGRAAAVKGDKVMLDSAGLNVPCRSDLWLIPGDGLTLCLRPQWLQWGPQSPPFFSPPLPARLIKADVEGAGHRFRFELKSGLHFDFFRADVPRDLRRPNAIYLLWWDQTKAPLMRRDMNQAEDKH